MRAPEFWSEEDVTARLTAAALAPFGFLYGAVTDWKRAHARPYRSRAKVICVGNLTAGGSGKTPVVEAVVGMLKSRGLAVAILSRGYGGKERGPIVVDAKMHDAARVGDEPLQLSQVAPVVVARDRPQGAALAEARGTDVIVMDDGHQNFTLVKDLSLVVVDAEKGFGNGRVLPAGPLRESVGGGLARADAVVLVGDGSPELPGYSGPVLRARLIPRNGETLKGRKILAFAGIGRPEKFFATLRNIGAELVETRAFADHHPYAEGEIAQLKEKARNASAMLVTTEKDLFRLTAAERHGIAALPIKAQFEAPDELQAAIEKALVRSGASR